jgi:DNA polymerase-1
MIDLSRALKEGEFVSRMTMTVHDELVLEVPVGERDRVQPVVCDVMESVTELRVPLVVDVGWGPTWADTK